jgi:hypothetical protein
VDWDFEDFSSSTAAAKLRNFRSPNLGVIDECATIVDCDGHIIAWILPKILSRAQLVSSFFRYFRKGSELLSRM